MMLLAEVARKEGLFDWLAAQAVQSAKGSAKRLFLIVYVVGTVVTVLLSNDATAVVLTPAVYAATRAAKVEPLPYLFICAFIANAASFVLPISNPANLVVFGSQMPPLSEWLHYFALPSVVRDRRDLCRAAADAAPQPRRGRRSHRKDPAVDARRQARGSRHRPDRRRAARCICARPRSRTADVRGRHRRDHHRAVDRSAVAHADPERRVVVGAPAGGGVVHPGRRTEPNRRAAVAGRNPERGRNSVSANHVLDRRSRVAVTSNLVNNLPMGLIAATTSHAGQVPTHVTGAILIGVDLGPNLSVTGSLATILWLIALRREGEHVAAWQFLKLGLVVMPPALLSGAARPPRRGCFDRRNGGNARFGHQCGSLRDDARRCSNAASRIS